MKNRSGLNTVITACALICAFALVLLCAMISLGAAEGEIKTAPGAPDSLVSAGAPRSQLELKRTFEAMSLSYEEGGLSVYEPISSEYRRAIEERKMAGETPALSVEEMLFVISDTAAAYDKYDIIRFKDEIGNVETEVITSDMSEREKMPLHRSALGRISDVSRIIELRVRAMSSESSFSETDGGALKYIPKQVERENSGSSFESERAFLFGLYSDSENYSEAVVFLPGNGSRVTLYPFADDAAFCRTKVILQNGRPATETEKKLLISAGIDPSRCRNITPEYFYGETALRLFAVGGRVMILDLASSSAVSLLPENGRLSSLAIAHGGDGETELYFTLAFDKSSSVMKYKSGEREAELMLELDVEYLAVCEPLTGNEDRVFVYRAVRREEERFVTALECVGDPVAEYFSE